MGPTDDLPTAIVAITSRYVDHLDLDELRDALPAFGPPADKPSPPTASRASAEPGEQFSVSGPQGNICGIDPSGTSDATDGSVGAQPGTLLVIAKAGG